MHKLKNETSPILLGIEIEASNPQSSLDSFDYGDEYINAQTQETIAESIKKDYPNFYSFGRDGCGIEIQSQPFSFKWAKENEKVFKTALKILEDNNFIGDSPKAGVHVHIDRKVFSRNQFRDFIRFLRDDEFKHWLHSFSGRG